MTHDSSDANTRWSLCFSSDNKEKHPTPWRITPQSRTPGLYGFQRYAVSPRDVLIVDQAFQYHHFVLERFKVAHGFLHVLQFHRHGAQNHIRRLCCQRTDSSLMLGHLRNLHSLLVMRSSQPLLIVILHASTVPFVMDCLHDTDYGLFSHNAKQLCKLIAVIPTLSEVYHA